MKRQLSKAPADKYIEPVVYHKLPERTKVQEVMCGLSNYLGPNDAAGRRAHAVNLLIALSHQHKVVKFTTSSWRSSVIYIVTKTGLEISSHAG
jgi:hypothetical protein